MITLKYDTRWVEKELPMAFAALPECYQADDCLNFWFDDDCVLRCAPKKDQEFAVGNWTAYFDYDRGTWMFDGR